jgi:hypothetical protein
MGTAYRSPIRCSRHSEDPILSHSELQRVPTPRYAALFAYLECSSQIDSIPITLALQRRLTLLHHGDHDQTPPPPHTTTLRSKHSLHPTPNLPNARRVQRLLPTTTKSNPAPSALASPPLSPAHAPPSRPTRLGTSATHEGVPSPPKAPSKPNPKPTPKPTPKPRARLAVKKLAALPEKVHRAERFERGRRR